MVLLVFVVGDGPVVQNVEKRGASNAHLENGGDTAVLGERVLVVPPPVCAASCAPYGCGGRVTAGQPGGQLEQLNLSERDVLLSVEHGGVVRPVHSLVVALGQLSQSHHRGKARLRLLL